MEVRPDCEIHGDPARATFPAEVIPSPFPDIRNVTIKQPVGAFGISIFIFPWTLTNPYQVFAHY